MSNIEKRISALEAVAGADAGPYTIEIVRGPTITKAEAEADATGQDILPRGAKVTRIEMVGVVPAADIVALQTGVSIL